MKTTWENLIIKTIKDYAAGFSSIRAAAANLGVNYETFKSWHDEKKSPTIKNLSPFIEQLGIGIPLIENRPSIRRSAPHAPTEKVEGENLPRIPVVGTTGAGDAVELFNAHPEYWLPVLPQYAKPEIIGLIVEGDSMEPTIHKGAVVGIIPYDGSINEGGIYLVQRPPFGRTIKRIKMGEDERIILHSDNPSYAPTPVPFEGYEKIILGRVIWIWQSC